jgi:PAS domain S-box-containing protein
MKNLNEIDSVDSLHAIQFALNSSSIIAITDKNGTIIFVNQKFCEISGYREDELLGQNHRILNSSYHSSEFFKHLWQTISNGKTWNGQICNRKKDGSLYWVQTLIQPIVDNQGQIEKYISIRHDITHFKEKELVEQYISNLRATYMLYADSPKQFYAYLLQSLIDFTDSEYGFIGEIKHKQTDVPYLKTYALTDISWSPETQDFYNKHINSGMEFHNLKTLFGHVMLSKKAYFTNDAKNDKLAGGIPPGHPALNAFLGVPIFHAGNMIAMFGMANRKLGYNLNLIERMTPVIELIGEIISIFNLERDASERSQRLELIASSSELGLWDWNIEADKVSYDDRYCEMIGYKRSEIIASFDFWRKQVHPDDIEAAIRALDDYLNNRNRIFELKFRMKHKLGHYVPILAKGKITKRDSSGKALHMVGTHFDLSYISSMELEIEEQRKVAMHQAKLASIGELAAGVGHEINNPLAIIKGFVASLNREFGFAGLENQKIKDYFKKINNSIDRITNIVTGLRTFSRSDASDFSHFDLAQLVQETSDMLKEIYATDGIMINYEKKIAENSLLFGNRGRVQQALMNLLSNAKDALATATRKEIIISIFQEHNRLILQVQDSGHGIAKEIQNKIFDAFFTTKEVGKGTGLGLALVNSVVKEFEGIINFSSEENLGTTFKLSFPMLDSTINRKMIAANIEIPDTIRPTNKLNLSSSLKILIVDDEDDIRELLVDILSDFGHKTVDVDNAADAYETFLKLDFDLIISDIKMPGMSGIELFKKIANNTDKKKPKLVFISGGIIRLEDFLSDPDYAQADELLPKPFLESDILKIIENIKK